MLAGLLALQLAIGDTLKIGSSARSPTIDIAVDSATWGPPQVRIRTGQGMALVWLLRVRDTVFVLGTMPDSTPSWLDEFVIGLDTEGDGAPQPQHDDFQLAFRRVLDSSVAYRGRNGGWEPPRADPDWRLGGERSGGGWEVSGGEDAQGWRLLVRLDPAWFAGEGGRLPRMAFRIYDNSPSGWFAWPPPAGTSPATSVERSPQLWVPVK